MSDNQKGFIVYGDIKETIDEMDDTQVAQLFRGMVDYFVEGKEPHFSGGLKFAFIPIKQQMDRAAKKYEEKCKKNRSNANKRWGKGKKDASEPMRTDATAYERMESYAMDANTNTKTDTDTTTKTDTDTTTKTDTDTTTTTKTDTESVVVVAGDNDFDLYKKLTPEDVDWIYDAYPESGGLLIDEVNSMVKKKRIAVREPVNYIFGYAEKVAWNDKERGAVEWDPYTL